MGRGYWELEATRTEETRAGTEAWRCDDESAQAAHVTDLTDISNKRADGYEATMA